jgi:broad specificity phosphatase PhoE
VRRARKFLNILYAHVREQVVVVITHSGFTRSLLLAVEREPYRPQNAEMVPVIVEKNTKYPLGWDEDAEDSVW